MTEFFTLTFIGLLMIISPGPDFAIVTKNSIGNGRMAGVGSAIGIGLANTCHVGLNLLGIGLIIAQSALLFTLMKVLGAIYLIYIGYRGLRAKPSKSTKSIELSDASNKESNNTSNIESSYESKNNTQGLKGFYSGFVTSLLNPKACLFYLSFFSVLLSPSTPLISQIFYGAWLSFLALAWFTLVAIFFTDPRIGNKLKECKHWIERFAGGALVVLGIRLLGAKAVI